MATDAIDQAALELEELVKSKQPKQAETLAETLEKSAAAEDGEEKKEDDDEDKEKMEQSHASSTAEQMSKSLADSEPYQTVIDATEALAVLGDATVNGFAQMEKSLGARLTKMEQHITLLMRAQAKLLRDSDERTPLRKPMPGNLGGFKKSESTQNGTTAYNEKQLKRAATILVEDGKLPAGSGALMNARGVDALYKSLDPTAQALFAETIQKEQL